MPKYPASPNYTPAQFYKVGFWESARTLMISETIVNLKHPTRLSAPEGFTEFSPGTSFKAGLSGRSHAEIVGSNPAGGMDVCCVLSGREVSATTWSLCPEESYRLWCVVVCDLETSRMRRPWPALGRSAPFGGGGSRHTGHKFPEHQGVNYSV
jgi:hypothetical protein